MDKPLVFCLMGPTASGKTELAIDLLEFFPFEIVSVDSAMVYRGMDIGSAKPDAVTLSRAPHHLINLRDPVEVYSVAEFCQDVHRVIRQITARGKIPLLVGGTMMYFRALQQGLAQLPPADEVIRTAINKEAESSGWSAMHYQLTQCDPETAKRLHPNDCQRIQRALEVYRITKQPLSQLVTQSAEVTSKYQYVNMALFPKNRAYLHARIAQRFHAMLSQGLLEEVKQLLQQWQLSPEHPSLRSVGYRQVWQYLCDELTLQEMIDKGIAATRQLAKRQLTWLRTWPELAYFQPWQIYLPVQLHDFIQAQLKR